MTAPDPLLPSAPPAAPLRVLLGAAKTALTCVVLWLLALLPRLHAVLLGYVTPDEPSWVFRGLRFSQALEAGRWADTFQIGHPGVITMWLSALGIWWQRWWTPGASDDLAWIDRVAWVTPDNSALFDRLAVFLPPARAAMAALCSLGIVGAYLLARRLWGHRVALAGAITMALNPFLAALSGLLHVDAPATTFLLLSLLAWLVALEQERRPPSVPRRRRRKVSSAAKAESTEERTERASGLDTRPLSIPGRHRRAADSGPMPRIGRRQRSTGRESARSAHKGSRKGFLGAALYALLSGLCAGLAILAKSPSIYALAAAGLSALLAYLLVPGRSWSRLGRMILLGLLWAVGLAAALYSFPAMWSNPLGVLAGIYGLAGRHLDVPHGVSFYRGAAGGAFGPGFYPTVLLYRLTPATMAGLALAVWATAKAVTTSGRAHVGSNDLSRSGTASAGSSAAAVTTSGRTRVGSNDVSRLASLLSLWAFAIGYTAFMTIAAKKFDRYLLPVFPVLDLLAAVGWVHALSRLAARRGPDSRLSQQAYSALLAGLVAVQLVVALPAWPYLLDVYNPLAGGLNGALRTLAVGWGEGSERIAAYLHEQGNPDFVLAAGSPVTIAPLVKGRVVVLDDVSRLVADKVLITALDWQIAPERVARTISGATLEHAVRVAGQEILWLYDTRSSAEAQHLARYGGPGDMVLCDASSSFCRNAGTSRQRGEPWNGSVHLVVGSTEGAIANLLNEVSATHTRLWYLAYPGATGDAATSVPSDLATPLDAGVLRRQLGSTATRLDHVDLGDATATLYILPQERRFEVSEQAFSRIRYGGQLAVTDGMLYDPQPAADEPIRFRLRWMAETSGAQGNYRAFVHLLDTDAADPGSGHLRKAGRGQELLVDERGWPTLYWEREAPGVPGVEREYTLGLPPGLPPGEYRLVLGVANAATDEWLPVVDAEGRIVGTTADLLPVQIGPPSTPPAPDAVHLAHPSEAAWQALRLLGHSAPSHAQAGQKIVIEAGWTSAKAAAGHPDRDVHVALGLVGPDGKYALRQTLPLSRYPTSRWRAGEVIHELYDLRLPAELPGGVYILALALLDGRGQSLSLDDGAELARLDTLRVSVQERLFELPRPPQQPLALSLGPAISLLGYDLEPSTDGSAGGPDNGAADRVSLTLYWRAEQPMETSYSVFVHLLDQAGQVQGQRDRVPMDGRAPTTGWIAGQIVVDEYEIPLDPDAPAGPFRIEVGMYNARDMTRLQMVDSEGKPLPDDRFLLPEEVLLEH